MTDITESDATATDSVLTGALALTTTTGKRRHASSLVWWTACTLWAYFVFGERVVAANCPEVLAVLGVVAGFAAAGRRVRASFEDTKATAIGATIVVALTTAFAILGPGLLATFVSVHNVVSAALLLTIISALWALWLVRHRERADIRIAPSKPAVPSILAWLLASLCTAVALILAAQT